jgi:hypothetical protein
MLGGLYAATSPNHLSAAGYGEEAIAMEMRETNAPSSLLHYGPFDVLPTFRAGVVYDDNIYIQSIKKTSDVIWTLSPGLVLAAGDYRQRESSLLTIAYSPSIILFTEHDRNDAVDHDALLDLMWRPASWTVELKQKFEKISGPVPEVANRTSRSLYNTALDIIYDLTPKTSLEIEGQQSINEWNNPLRSYNEWTGGGWLNYWITPKVQLGAGLTAGFMDISQEPNQTYQQALIRAKYAVSEKLELRISGGPELREFQGRQSDRVGGIFGFGMTYNLSERTRLLLDVYRRDRSSLVLSGQNYTATGFTAGLRQVLSDGYTLRLDGGFENANYYSTTSSVKNAGQFDYFFIRTALEVQLRERLTLEAFYQYRQRHSSSAANEFYNHQIGLSSTYHF